MRLLNLELGKYFEIKTLIRLGKAKSFSQIYANKENIPEPGKN